VEAFGETGERLALIRQPSLERSYYDTAFCLQFLIGIAVALTVFFLAPLTMVYFHEPRAVAVMRVLALRAVLGGIENIGTVDFRRDLQFHRFYSLAMRAKLLSLATTLILAAWLRNYWALAIGILANQAATTILSYVMHPYRPRLSLARRREIFGFSGWTLLRSAGLYLTSQVDQFAVGGFASAGAMGRYAVAMDVATSPTAEINEPVIAVLYPVMSKCRQDKPAIRSLFARTFGWAAIVCSATGVGIMAIAPDYCLLVLGPQWQGAASLVPWLALSAALLGLGSASDTVFDALGTPSVSTRLQWLRLCLMAGAVATAAILVRSTQAVAIARLAVSCVFAPLVLFAVGRTIGVSLRDYTAAAWRPLIAAFFMGGAVIACAKAFPAASPIRLLAEVPLGAMTYGGTLFLLWYASGRPPGPEADLAAMGRSMLVTVFEWRVSRRGAQL
jgi:O-antigen/teichoic acid export membrane protein